MSTLYNAFNCPPKARVAFARAERADPPPAEIRNLFTDTQMGTDSTDKCCCLKTKFVDKLLNFVDLSENKYPKVSGEYPMNEVAKIPFLRVDFFI